MASLTPVPVRASVRDLLRDLLGCATKVKDAPAPQVLSTDKPALVAIYRRDDGSAAAACVSDQDFAARAGAAIAMMPLADAMPHDPAKGLDEDIAELFHEVVNVLAKLMNSPTSPHVTLREVLQLPGNVPADIAALVTGPGKRSDYRVDLDGFGEGTLTLLAG
jgi:hypothetical protein